MISVVHDNSRCKLTLKGHAGHGAYGHDLVCASASILVYTLAAALENLQSEGLITGLSVSFLPGDAEVSCEIKEGSRDTITRVFDTVGVGFRLLARDYPRNISYQMTERNKG